MASNVYRQLAPYAVAISSTAIALLLSLLLEPFLSITISVFFAIAIAITTCYGGIKPGILSSVLSTLAIDYFSIPPIGQIYNTNLSEAIRLSVFLLVAWIVDVLKNNLQESKRNSFALNKQLPEENPQQLPMALAAARMGLWDWDIQTGKITWSPEHELLFGMAEGTFDGRYETFEACLHPEERQGIRLAVEKASENHSIFQHEYRILWPDGSIRWAEGRGQFFYDSLGRAVRMMGTVIDITDRKQTAEVLERQNRQIQIFSEITQKIRQSLQLEEILHTAVTEVQQLLNADRVLIFQLLEDGSGTVVQEAVLPGYPAVLGQNLYHRCFNREYYQTTVKAIADIDEAGIEPCYVEFLKQFAVRANLVVPILIREDLWGLLIAHQCSHPRQWTSFETELLQQLANQIGIALAQSQLLEQETRQRAELQESKERFRRAIVDAPLPIAIYAEDGEILQINRAWTNLSGYQPEEIPTISIWTEKLFGNDRETVLTHINRLFEINSQVHEGEYTLIDRLGKTLIWDFHSSPLKTLPDGRRVRIVMALDVTERKQVEQALQLSEEKFRQAVLNSAMPIAIHAEDGEILLINQVWTEITGYTQADIPTIADWLEKAYGERRQPIRADVELLYQLDKRICQGEYAIATKQGEDRFWVFCSASLGKLPDGRRLVISTALDITERKQAEIVLQQTKEELELRVIERTAELTEVNDRLLMALLEQQRTKQILQEQAALLELAHDTILTRSWDGIITFWNGGAEQMYGWSKTEAIGQVCNILLQTRFPLPLAEFEALLLDKGYWEGELIHTRKDGVLIIVASRWVVQKDNSGRPIKILEINNDITDRKQAEERLRRSETALVRAQRIAHIGSWEFDINTQTTIWSEELYRIHGLNPNDPPPTPEQSFLAIHPDDRPLYLEEVFAKASASQPFEVDLRIIRPDGEIRYVNIRGESIFDERERAIKLIGTTFDITERKRTEEALRQSEEKFRQIAENIQDVFWMFAPKEEQLIYVSPAYEKVWGRSCASLYEDFREWIDAIHPDDRQKTATAFFENACKGLYDEKYRIIRPDGSIRWIRDRGFPVKDESGAVLRVAGIAEDITDRQQIETERTKLLDILDASSDIIATARLDTQVEYVNKAGRKIFGLAENESIGNFCILNGQPQWAYEIIKDIGIPAAIRDGVWVGETAFLLQDGREIPTSQMMIAHKFGTNEVKLLSTIARDISKQKQTEASLREAERRWRTLLENVQLLVVEVNRLGNVEYVNPFFLQLTGFSESEIIGQNWFDNCIPLADRQLVYGDFHQLLEQDCYPHYQNHILTKSGETVFIAWNNSVLRDLQGNITGSISIGEDITKRQEIDRIKSEFISIVSHELRTPLTAIRGALGLLAAGVYNKKPEKAKQMVQIAAQQSDRLVRLVNDILDLQRLESGRAELLMQSCDAAALIRQSVDVMRPSAEINQIAISVSDCTIQVWAEPDSIIQTLTNLLSNAIKFSSPGSTIWLSVEPIESKDTESIDRQEPFSDRLVPPYALFKVEDRGRGIPVDKIETIFERFQQVDVTDSRQKGGTGLGLSICRRIIQQHGGQIWAESVLGEGSTFYFTLPLTPE